MTVPAHTNTTTAAVLTMHTLRWHQPSQTAACLSCTFEADRIWSLPRLALTQAEHQADVLSRAGLLADPTTRTEWGVRCDDAEDDVIEADDREDAERIRAHHDAGMDHGHTIVRRTVTDWTPAEENEHG